MEDILIFPAGSGNAVGYAATFLQQNGIPLTDHPTPDATHLLLDIPTMDIPFSLLERLPEEITIVGGNLDHSQLAGYNTIDLLHNEEYLAKNAAITAECAVHLAAARSNSILSGASVLVIGWGRIGKCLASLLKKLQCQVIVSARNPADRAILKALGYHATDVTTLGTIPDVSLIFNTVPAPVHFASPTFACLKIDLASKPGLMGEDVIQARGLPGRYAPKSSGKLIADTFIKEVTT